MKYLCLFIKYLRLFLFNLLFLPLCLLHFHTHLSSIAASSLSGTALRLRSALPLPAFLPQTGQRKINNVWG